MCPAVPRLYLVLLAGLVALQILCHYNLDGNPSQPLKGVFIMPDQNRVQWVYASGSNDELARRYDQWASTYDTDL